MVVAGCGGGIVGYGRRDVRVVVGDGCSRDGTEVVGCSAGCNHRRIRIVRLLFPCYSCEVSGLMR